jgi:opacity protein-like surface antigen
MVHMLARGVNFMKAILSLLAATGFMISFARADDAAPVVAPLPDGWTARSDGGYAHAQSGVACTKVVGTYNFVRLDGASDPGILGVCIYSGGDVRVRRRCTRW